MEQLNVFFSDLVTNNILPGRCVDANQLRLWDVIQQPKKNIKHKITGREGLVLSQRRFADDV